MISLSREEAAVALGLESLPCPIVGVSIDSRTLHAGDLFVALRGERFDGHDYVAQALAAGACGVVVEEGIWRRKETVLSARERSLVFVVRDSLEALGSLARTVRRKSGALVVAVTGSVGKTGTKDLIAAMAARTGAVVATAGNQNNEVGVPLTLLSLEPGTRFAVVEMGMRGHGQIAALARVAEPDVAVITNIHPVHLELVGALEDVAKAKAELLFGLRSGGVAVLPFDAPLLESHALAAGWPVVRFGFGPGSETAEVRGEAGRVDGRSRLRLSWPDGSVNVETPFSSGHRMENAVAAAAACYAAGLPLEECAQGLTTAVFTPSRGDVVALSGITVINDAYNANPAAVRAAIDDLMDVAREQNGRAVAVLGDMLELGPEAARYHWEVGAYAAEAGVSGLWGIGPLSLSTVEGFVSVNKAKAEVNGGTGPIEGRRDSTRDERGEGRHVEDLEYGSERILGSLRTGDVVLIKGSRAMRLETLVEAAVVRFARLVVGGPCGPQAGD